MPGLDLHHADALVLTGRHSAPPSPSGDAADEVETAGGAGLGATGSGLGITGPAPGSAGPGLGATGSGLGSTGTGFGSVGTGFGATGTAPLQRGLGRPLSLPGRDTEGPATDEGDDPDLAPGPPAAGTYRGLPRRVRQASLNPRLKDNPAAARGRNADIAPPSGGRSPDEARSLVASMQSGWQRGREDDSDGESAAADQAAGRQDSEAPQGEEALWTSRARRPGPDSN
jgi:hypothetical protein